MIGDYIGFRVQGLESELLKGGYIGILLGTTVGVIKGDTRSLDYGSDAFLWGLDRVDGGYLAARRIPNIEKYALCVSYMICAMVQDFLHVQ